jgi:hypothetical protein
VQVRVLMCAHDDYLFATHVSHCPINAAPHIDHVIKIALGTPSVIYLLHDLKAPKR